MNFGHVYASVYVGSWKNFLVTNVCTWKSDHYFYEVFVLGTHLFGVSVLPGECMRIGILLGTDLKKIRLGPAQRWARWWMHVHTSVFEGFWKKSLISHVRKNLTSLFALGSGLYFIGLIPSRTHLFCV